MTVHHRDLQGALAVPPPAVYPAKHPLPASNLAEFARDFVVFTPSAACLAKLIADASPDFEGRIASKAPVARIISHNPDSLWGITRKSNYDAENPVPDGFLAFLMLNSDGQRALIEGTFDASEPDLNLLCSQNEKPAAIYIWAVWGKNLFPGVLLAFEKVWTPLYKDADLYARATTAHSARLLETLGFTPGASFEGRVRSDLHCLVRSPKRAAPSGPLYDRYDGNGKPDEVAVTVVHTMEEFMRIVSVRSAVFMAEQECPYREEFDGNDFASTHLLAYLGNEPIGCLRIRFFADFAKIERLTVRKEFRARGATRPLVEAAIDLCKAKGYQRMYGHAARHVVKLWEQFGFSVIEGAKEFVFSDFEYVEMELFTERRPTAVTIGIDPYLTIRPEGQWHKPGVLEVSATRPVTRPSIGA
jgi:predicted GNAT family N-acyltransferase